MIRKMRLTFHSLHIDVLTLIREAAKIAENLVGERALQDVLQALHEHDLHLQLLHYRDVKVDELPPPMTLVKSFWNKLLAKL
jgi:hypothetical protein